MDATPKRKLPAHAIRDIAVAVQVEDRRACHRGAPDEAGDVRANQAGDEDVAATGARPVAIYPNRAAWSAIETDVIDGDLDDEYETLRSALAIPRRRLHVTPDSRAAVERAVTKLSNAYDDIAVSRKCDGETRAFARGAVAGLAIVSEDMLPVMWRGVTQ